MPKRPTGRALAAERQLLARLARPAKNPGVPLPTVRQLGGQFGLSYSSVSRLLQRFVQEGRVWQHPNGRFFPGAAGPMAVVGLPMVVVGRQIQHWSRLYQEILEGVSEVCSARGCPLLFLSSDKLVQHDSPERPPAFASREVQAAELQRLAPAMPRLCAGLLLDHLWEEELLSAVPFPPAPQFILARSSGQATPLSISPDFAAGARLILEHLRPCGCKRIFLGVPFRGDQAVTAAGDALAAEASRSNLNIEPLDCSTPAKRKAAISRLSRLKTPTPLICTEDNVASLLWQGLRDAQLQDSRIITLISIQGTGAIDLPIIRLRYDYRQLGRDAVMAAIERRRTNSLIAPALLLPNMATLGG